MILLDGKKIRDLYRQKLTERIKTLGFAPLLVIIQIGDNKESSIYIKRKKEFAKLIGAKVEHIKLLETVSFEEIKKYIEKFNSDKNVNGIIVQLPIPNNLDKDNIINLINPLKDIDGLTDENQNLLETGNPRFIPATAKAVNLILDFYKINFYKKNIAVLGRSKLVGKPTANLLSNKGGVVSVCHSKTDNVKSVTKNSDIVIVAIGKPSLINQEYIKEDSVVIDVGINNIYGQELDEEINYKNIVGDVDFQSVKDIVKAITPVPGGVGPVTVTCLFDNLVESASKML